MPVPLPVPTLPKIIERPTGYGVPQPTLPRILEESSSYGSSYTTPFVPPPPTFTPPPRIFETTTAGYGYTQPSIVFTPPTPRVIERPTGYGAPRFIQEPMKPRLISGY